MIIDIALNQEKFVLQALQELSGPQRGWRLNTLPDYYELLWDKENVLEPIPFEIILERANELKKIYDNLEYQRLRANEYPSIQEQLDMQYWDKINGTTVWQDTVQAIKDKYPKPEVI